MACRLFSALLALCFTTQVFANADQDARIAALEARVAQLESLLIGLGARPEETEPPAATEPVPTLNVGGRIKVDFVANSSSTGGTGGRNRGDVQFLPRAIPINDVGEHNQLSGNARDSRIWLSASTPTQVGELGAYLELDFGSFDNSATEAVSNSHNPRLHHGYATFRGFTIGQTASTFQDNRSFPEINDALGPAGVLNVRQPLVRYETGGPTWRWANALEQPETTLVDTAGVRSSPDDDRWPDYVSRISHTRDRSRWSVALLVRELRLDDGTGARDTLATGVSATGRLYVDNANNFRFTLAGGEGIGRYLSYNAFSDALLEDSGGLTAIPAWGGFASYQHWWGERWRTNLAVGYANSDVPDALAGLDTVNRRFVSSHLNLLWSPVPDATFGLEWLYGKREVASGLTADLHRLQFTSVYNFRR